jgi:hypothetical protein
MAPLSHGANAQRPHRLFRGAREDSFNSTQQNKSSDHEMVGEWNARGDSTAPMDGFVPPRASPAARMPAAAREDEELVTVAFHKKDAGFRIPKPGEALPVTRPAARRSQLDVRMLHRRREETGRLHALLAGIFNESSQHTEENGGCGVTGGPGGAPTTPARVPDTAHRDLLAFLAAKECWSRREYSGLCARFGLMDDGAMEVLNAWAFDHGAEAVLEDGDPVLVNVTAARELLNEH